MERLFHEYNLLAMFAISVTLHDYACWRRTSWRRCCWSRSTGAVCVASMLLPMPEAYSDFRGYANFSGQTRRSWDAWKRQLDPVLAYDTQAPNPWCNTLSHLYRY